MSSPVVASEPIVSSCPLIEASHSSGIATIVINNIARHNIMTLAAWQAFPDIVAQIETLSDIRLIIVRGAGEKAFIAGADISEFDTNFKGADGFSYDRATVNAFTALRNTMIPSLAAIRGYCIGGGLALALSCDIRLCSDDAVFAIPAGRLGLAYPSEAVHRLAEIVGDSHARDILFSAGRYSAAQAHHMHLVNHVFEKHSFEAALSNKVDQICQNAPLSLRAAKITLEEGRRGDQDRIAQAAITCLESEDYQEGLRAFTEGRTPAFRGR